MGLVFAILLFVTTTFWSTLPAAAQNIEPARVGVLSLHGREHEHATKIGASAVLRGMRALGYSEGHNLVTHVRHADGDRARLRSLAAELASVPVEVIVAVGTEATQAARDTTSSIPIVMAGIGDPIGAGLVASLAHPGGNLTGTALLNPETAEKQLEALKEAAPHVRKIAILRRPSYPAHDRVFDRLERTAATSGLQLAPAIIGSPDDVAREFDQMRASGVDAFIVLANPALDDMRDIVAEHGLWHKLPGAGWQEYHVHAGLLLSYGPSLSDMHARAATYVDKILRGAKPADLPVEQAERFKLAINLKTAKALGLTTSPTLLARADEVIE